MALGEIAGRFRLPFAFVAQVANSAELLGGGMGLDVLCVQPLLDVVQQVCTDTFPFPVYHDSDACVMWDGGDVYHVTLEIGRALGRRAAAPGEGEGEGWLGTGLQGLEATAASVALSSPFIDPEGNGDCVAVQYAVHH